MIFAVCSSFLTGRSVVVKSLQIITDYTPELNQPWLHCHKQITRIFSLWRFETVLHLIISTNRKQEVF